MKDKIHITRMIDNKRISDLISKNIVWGLSEKENSELHEWINESEHNLHLYIDIVSKENIENYMQDRENIDISRNWHSFQNKLSKGKKRKFISIFSRYAAVLLVIISLGVVFYEISITKNLTNQLAKSSSTISRSNRARLILEDGKQINLSSEVDTSLINNSGISINKDSSVIRYAYKKYISNKPKINKIVVPRGGEYNLVLCDGTRVYLNSETEIEFPVNFVGKRRKVKVKGEAFFKVAKDKSMPFVVETEYMNVVVTGTHFNVKAYSDDDKIQTTLVEGGVDVYYGPDKKYRKSIIPSQQAGIVKGKKGITIRKVDTDIYTSWMNKYFIFKNARLEDIMKTLSRWYDVNVFYQNSEIKDVVFDGKLKRYESIKSILEIIETTNSIKTEIHDGTIIFKEK